VLIIVWAVVMVAVFYVFLWRPQQRRMGAVRSLQGQLKVGDDVVTTSGIFGTVIELGDNDLRLEIAPGTVVRVARGAIGERLTVDQADPEADAE
jgi:preprotein translocase subunit YajC